MSCENASSYLPDQTFTCASDSESIDMLPYLGIKLQTFFELPNGDFELGLTDTKVTSNTILATSVSNDFYTTATLYI